MNTYLCKKINNKLSLNISNYISQIYKLDNIDIAKTDKYNQIEILSWVNKTKSQYIRYKILIKETAIYLHHKNIKILPKSISLLVNLELIFLHGNKIVDYSNIYTLPNLKQLCVNPSDDISELKKNLINCELYTYTLGF